MIEEAGVGREIRARRAADRLLVDAHEPPDASIPSTISPPVGCVSAAIARALRRSSGAIVRPRRSATSSTSAWLTRLDLPEPDTPVTVVKHAERERGIELMQVVARDLREPQPAAKASRGVVRGARVRAEEMLARLRFLDLREPRRRPAVHHMAALFARSRADIDEPVRATHHVEIVLDDEERIAGRLEPLECREKRFACRPDAARPTARRARRRRRTDCERELRREAQPLQFARRKRRRRAIEREVAEAEVEHAALENSCAMRCAARFRPTCRRAPHVRRVFAEPPLQRALSLGMRLRVALSRPACGRSAARDRAAAAAARDASEIGDVEPGERHRQRLALQPLAVTGAGTRCRSCSATRASSSARSACSRTCAARSGARR